MTTYRLYLRDDDWAIVGRDDFAAEDDRRAILIARALCAACADRCAGYGLWQGTRRVNASFPLRQPDLPPEQLPAKAQDIVLERELALLESRWTIADSVRLLERTARLLSNVGFESPHTALPAKMRDHRPL